MEEGRGRGSCFPHGSQDTDRSEKITGAVCASPGHVSDVHIPVQAKFPKKVTC